MNYEQKALYYGVGINIFSSVLGLIFFIVTKSSTLFLDAFISVILCISTIISIFVSKVINKKDNEKYPLGRYAIENVFLVFRSILMLLIIAYTLIDGISTIVKFYNNTLESNLNISILNMSIYCLLMSLSCFAITLIYKYYNKKLETPSMMISLEIKSSLYDGLVTIVATTSLIIFTYVPFLNPIKEIGDSIVVIILSLIYMIAPIKELTKQIIVLTDKRKNQGLEKKLYKEIKNKFNNFEIYDVYCSYSGEVVSIYVCLFPVNTMSSDEINKNFKNISSYLGGEYQSSKIYLMLTKNRLHAL